VLALAFGRSVAGRFVPESSFLDVFLGFLFLDSRSWRSCPGRCATGHCGYWEPYTVSAVGGRAAADDCLASCKLWLARYFKGYFRSVRVIENILLSERNGGGGSRGNGRVSCTKRSEREQGRKITHKKV